MNRFRVCASALAIVLIIAISSAIAFAEEDAGNLTGSIDEDAGKGGGNTASNVLNSGSGSSYGSNIGSDSIFLSPSCDLYSGNGELWIISTGFFNFFTSEGTLTANGAVLSNGVDYEVESVGGCALFIVYESALRELYGTVSFVATFTNGASGACVVSITGMPEIPEELAVTPPKSGDAVNLTGFIFAAAALAIMAKRRICVR